METNIAVKLDQAAWLGIKRCVNALNALQMQYQTHRKDENDT